MYERNSFSTFFLTEIIQQMCNRLQRYFDSQKESTQDLEISINQIEDNYCQLFSTSTKMYTQPLAS